MPTLHRFALAVACAVTGLASAATDTSSAAKACNTESALKGLVPQPGLYEALKQAFNSNACDSVIAVMKRLSQSKKVGGRKLQEPTALDPQAAQREWQAARADPEFAQRLAAALQPETDPLRRKLVEAALLHEYGHYRARDLQLQQIAAAAGD
jgi:hypothetical protein